MKVRESKNTSCEDNFTKLKSVKSCESSNVPHAVGRDYAYLTKHNMFSDEFSLFHTTSSNFFKKFKKKKIGCEVPVVKTDIVDSFDKTILTGYSTTDDEVEFFRKVEVHKNGQKKRTTSAIKNINGSLSKKESAIFFEWFSCQMCKYKSEKYGPKTEIPIQYVIDDFMEAQVFTARSQAFDFLRFVDKDRNGSISINEFVSVFCDVENPDHIAIMKDFLKTLIRSSRSCRESMEDLRPTARRSKSCRAIIRYSDISRSSSSDIISIRRHQSNNF
jgi:hypothetical protein